MGCWNETCMVTRAPIIHGDEVVVFILKGSGVKLDTGDTIGGICYNNFLFSPYPYAFHGQYNDYGSVEGVAAENLTVAQALVDNAIKGFHKEDLKLETGRDVFYNIERGNYPGLTLAFVHKHIFEVLVKELGERISYNSTVGTRHDTVTACELINKKLAEGYILPQYAFEGAMFKNYRIQLDADKAAEACLFIDAMQLMRVTWMPNTTAGGQVNETRLWDVVHKQCSKDFDKAVEEYEEYKEEGDRDYGSETKFGAISEYVGRALKSYAIKPPNLNEDDDDDDY